MDETLPGVDWSITGKSALLLDPQMEQFRKWLMTPDGQELLAEINQQGANARYLEQAG